MRATIAITAALVAVATWTWARHHDDAMFEIDESAWVLSSGQLREPWDAPSWHQRSAANHPAVGKALFAIALAPGDLWTESPAAHERWLDDAMRVFHRGEFLAQLAVTVTPAHLSRARAVSALFFVVAGLCLFACARRAFGVPSAAIAVLLFALSPLTLRIASQALVDMPFVAVALGAAALACAWASEPSASRRRAYAAALGVVCGLAMNVKLNGAAALPFALLAVVVADPARLRTRTHAAALFAEASIASICFVVIAWATNPAFWPNPIDGLRYALEVRLQAIEEQKIVFYGDWLRTPALRLSAFADHALVRVLPIGGGAAAAVVAALCTAASVAVVRPEGSTLPRSPAARALLALAAAWTALSLATFVIRWDRYVFPAVPFLLAFAAAGLVDVVMRVRRARANASTTERAASRPFAIALAAGAACGAMAAGLAAWGTMDLDQARHPDEWHAMRLRQVEHFLAREPNDPVLHARKAWVLEHAPHP